MSKNKLALVSLIALLPIIGLYPVTVSAEDKVITFPIKEQFTPVIEPEMGVLVPDIAVAERLYQEWLVQQEKDKKPVIRKSLSVNKKATGYDVCSCVSYARFKTGIYVQIPRRLGYRYGLAKDHPINSSVPIVGAIMITYESSSGHALEVTGYDSMFVYVTEANYSRCKVTVGRKIPINSSLIKGYYK